jgi:excinuclease ABC subunit C
LLHESTALALNTNLTRQSGVYQYYDKGEKFCMWAKLKSKKRVSSYFNKIHDTKTNVLVKKIVTIKHIVPTETDALLLENNLIKTLQPRYNVLLRDDKVILGYA